MLVTQSNNPPQTCITTLAVRHLAMGGGTITQLNDLRAPMASIMSGLAAQLAELQRYKAVFGDLGAAASPGLVESPDGDQPPQPDDEDDNDDDGGATVRRGRTGVQLKAGGPPPSSRHRNHHRTHHHGNHNRKYHHDRIHEEDYDDGGEEGEEDDDDDDQGSDTEHE